MKHWPSPSPAPPRRRLGLFRFHPVPVARRADGWTPARQAAFIGYLAETRSVIAACRRVGMSRTSADNLRRRPCGVHFRRAWDTALDYSLYRIEEEMFARAIVFGEKIVALTETDALQRDGLGGAPENVGGERFGRDGRIAQAGHFDVQVAMIQFADQ